jgi:enoyl-CoA hydratase/carnithine racemase
LQTRQEGNIAIIQLDSGDQNRFEVVLLLQLIETLKEFETREDIKALVFTGTHPKYFSTGLNIDWVKAHEREDIVGLIQLMHHLLYDTLLYPKPIVGALNGHTFGFGAIWACCFDFRFMNQDKGFFCFPEVEVPFDVPPTLMEHLEVAMPASTLQRVVLSAERMPATKALELGLLQEIVPPEEVVSRSVAFAEMLSQKNLRNYTLCKRRIREKFSYQLAEGRDSDFAFEIN